MMKTKILKPNNDRTGIVLWLSLGIALFPHGVQKMLGLFRGFGFNGTMNFFTDTMHLPYLIDFCVILIEFFGSLSVLLGLASRVWSIAISGLFIGITLLTQVQNGFFMN